MADKELSKKLKSLRLNKGLTQKDVYEQLRISQSTFSSWEVGKSEPDAMTFLKLCKIYEVEDILYEFTGEHVNSEKDQTMELLEQLDIEDKAEIRGEIKHMLKADKYKNKTITDDITETIEKTQRAFNQATIQK